MVPGTIVGLRVMSRGAQWGADSVPTLVVWEPTYAGGIPWQNPGSLSPHHRVTSPVIPAADTHPSRFLRSPLLLSQGWQTLWWVVPPSGLPLLMAPTSLSKWHGHTSSTLWPQHGWTSSAVGTDSEACPVSTGIGPLNIHLHWASSPPLSLICPFHLLAFFCCGGFCCTVFIL